jgi:3',5'-cyclic AMP phosphodiesterase CpdA
MDMVKPRRLHEATRRDERPLSSPPRRHRSLTALVLMLVLLGAVAACSPAGEPTLDHASGPVPSLTKAPTTRLAMAGDTGTGAGSAIDATVEEMLVQDDSYGYDALVLLGDLIYPDGDAEEVPSRINGVFEPLVRRGVQLVPVLGNHDYRSDEQSQILQAMGRSASWYAETVGIVRVIVLDSEQVDNPDQRAWLEKTLATPSDAPWTVVAMHKPAYSAGHHGSDEAVQDAWVPLFEQYDVPLVVAGHDHDYQRSKAINGVTYVVSGAAANLRPTGSQDFTAVSASIRHFLDLAASRTELIVRAIDQDGGLLDSLTLRR